MISLHAKQLAFGFQQNHLIFDDLNFALKPGEIFVLLGGNGAGKTTLLRTLAGQLLPDAGAVMLDQRNIHQWTKREVAQRLAMMPQSEFCETSFTVRDMIRLGRAPHRGWLMPLTTEDETAVDEAISTVKLKEIADQPVCTLSGGQWRRAILARSLAQDASILLLDEMTSGLDLKHQYECLAEVRQIVKQKNLIAVLTMHDLNHAGMFADRIALLANQQIIAIGDSQSTLTAELIEKTYGIKVTIAEHPIHGTPLVVPIGAAP